MVTYVNHYENDKGFFLRMPGGMIAITAHPTEEKSLLVGKLFQGWKEGEPLTYEYAAEVSFSTLLPSKRQPKTVQEAIDKLKKAWIADPDRANIAMVMLARTPYEDGSFPKVKFREFAERLPR